MIKTVKRAIVTLAVGEKYLRLYRSREPALAALAKRSGADLHCIDKPLDPDGTRPILFQKLLIADRMREYDEFLFLDLDVLFRENILDPFEIFKPGMGLAAVVQPRETQLYADVATRLWRRPEIARSLRVDYFKEQGLPHVNGLVGPINGGVWLCRPRLVADAYRDAYFDTGKWKYVAKHEEPVLAWVPQSMGVFQELPFEYNAQLCFTMFQPQHFSFGRRFAARWRIALRALIRRQPRLSGLLGMAGYDDRYQLFARRCVEENIFVHFSGDMVMPN